MAPETKESPTETPAQAEPAQDEQQVDEAVSNEESAPETESQEQADQANNPDSAAEGQAETDESEVSAQPADEQDEEKASTEEGADNKDGKLSRILSMKVPIIVKISQKKMRVRDICKFHLGSVISFDQDAYQHVDLMVNNRPVGLGQPVKIGENFGLRITQISDLTETIKSLGGKK